MFLFIFLSSLVFSHSATSAELLIAAQDIDSLIRANERIEVLNKYNEGCEWEMKNKQFPSYCFRAMELVLKEPQDLVFMIEKWEKVNQLCVETVNQVQSLSLLDKYRASNAVSNLCIKAIEIRNLDLKYVQTGKVGPKIELNHNYGMSTGQ